MLVLQIKNIRNFMNCLLRTESFDAFPVLSASVTTFASFSIDGTLHSEFYDPEEAQELKKAGRTQALWRDIRPYCHSLIRGKHTPLAFKIIFQFPGERLARLLASSGASYGPEDVYGVSLTIQYDGKRLLVSTGCALRIFTADRALEQAWEKWIVRYLDRLEVEYEQ